MPIDPSRIGFAALTRDHLPLIADWLARPHLREWWGEPERELADICDYVEGRGDTRPFLIELDGEPVGYIQWWQVRAYQNPEWFAEAPWLRGLPADAIGVDLFIGEPELTGGGLGQAALRKFAGSLREAGHATIIIDPDPANRRAVRAYEKAGFRAMESLAGRAADVLLMQFETRSKE